MSHTPGPWKIVHDEEMPWGVVRCEADGAYRHMRVRCEGFGQDEAAANTKLVAAAPDLLEACAALLKTTFVKDQFKYLDKGIGTSTGGGKAILAARAAIKKAQGKQ